MANTTSTAASSSVTESADPNPKARRGAILAGPPQTERRSSMTEIDERVQRSARRKVESFVRDCERRGTDPWSKSEWKAHGPAFTEAESDYFVSVHVSNAVDTVAESVCAAGLAHMEGEDIVFDREDGRELFALQLATALSPPPHWKPALRVPRLEEDA